MNTALSLTTSGFGALQGTFITTIQQIDGLKEGEDYRIPEGSKGKITIVQIPGEDGASLHCLTLVFDGGLTVAVVRCKAAGDSLVFEEISA